MLYLRNMHFKALLIAAIAALPAFAEPPTLALPDSLLAQSDKVTQLTMSLKYDEAFAVARKIRKVNGSAGCILENVVRISRYDDLGDTTALKHAGTELESCKSEGMWEALRKFELGYVQSETGHSIKGAMQTRSAAKIFEDSEDLEARAFFAIYAYYVDKSFSWLPFKSDRRKEYLTVLDEASKKSRNFWPLFLTPLIWMHYDKGDFATGLKLSERALAKSPNHPVFVQIKADMLYCLKRYAESAALYESSAADYLRRSGKSIRYWCAVLNLVRIYNDAGDKEKADEWRKKLDDPAYKALKNWMPASLMGDLEARKLL